jgi:hypothetical protein
LMGRKSLRSPDLAESRGHSAERRNRAARQALAAARHEALVATLPLATVAYEPEPNAKGERLIWLEEIWLNKLDAMRQPSESDSDLILRLIELGGVL